MVVALLLLVCLVLAGAVVALVRLVRRVEARLAELEERPTAAAGFETGASAPSSTGAALVEEVAQRPSRNQSDAEDFVITRLGEEPEVAPRMESSLFADVVMRETVVKAASWTYAVRRSLSPANRNRIWFEMRREVKRARKDRKAEEREAIREYRARRRSDLRQPVQEESAA